MKKSRNGVGLSEFIPAISGAIAGCTSRMIIAPLDVIKIRYQVQLANKGPYYGIYQSMKHIINNEGYSGLWKGNVAGLYLYGVYSFVQFGIFDSLDKYSKDKSFWKFINGGIAGTIGTLVSYPIDVIRTQMSINGARSSLSTAISEQYYRYSSNGTILGFWKGSLPAILQIFPYMGCNFSVFYFIHESLEPVSGPFWSGLISGSISGFISKTIVLPLDVIKRRFQIQGLIVQRTVFSQNTFPVYHSMISLKELIKKIWNEEGPKAFFKGFWPSIIKATPGTAITFAVHTFLIRLATKQ